MQLYALLRLQHFFHWSQSVMVMAQINESIVIHVELQPESAERAAAAGATSFDVQLSTHSAVPDQIFTWSHGCRRSRSAYRLGRQISGGHVGQTMPSIWQLRRLQ